MEETVVEIDYRNMSDVFENILLTLHQKEKTMEKVKMSGALVGDIIGSVYEFNNT